MGRKKVPLAFIEDDNARKSILKKRRQGLLKKVNELSILCGVEMCAVIMSPDENEPAFWPPSRADVVRLLERYVAIPEVERSKKKVNQEMYLRERNNKLIEQHKRLARKNNYLENHYLMQQLYLYNKTTSELALTELQSLLSFAEEKIAEIQRRIEYIEQRDAAPQSADAPGSMEEEEETSPKANPGDVGSGAGGDDSSYDFWFRNIMKSGNVAGSSASKKETSNPLAYPTGSVGTSSHDVAMNLPQEDVGVGSGNRGHGGGPVYGRHNNPMMPNYVGDMSGGLPVGFPHGNVPGSSSTGDAHGYPVGPPYPWEIRGSNSGHGAVFPHGGNNNIIDAATQPQENPGGLNSHQGMVLPVATGGSGFGMGVYLRNERVGLSTWTPPLGNVITVNAESGFGVNQGNAGARSQGGGSGGYGEAVPPGNTENELLLPTSNAGTHPGGSGGNN